MASNEDTAPVTAIDVEHPRPGLAVINVRGEHDLGSRAALGEAYVRATAGSPGDVLVDLTECTFLDSVVLGVLLDFSQRLETRGARLALVIPPEARIVYRISSVAGIAGILRIYESRAAAEAA